MTTVSGSEIIVGVEANNDEKFAASMRNNNNVAIAIVFLLPDGHGNGAAPDMDMTPPELIDEEITKADEPPFELLNEA